MGKTVSHTVSFFRFAIFKKVFFFISTNSSHSLFPLAAKMNLPFFV